MDLQTQYDMIHFYFRTTTEPYDALDWDGKTLNIRLDGAIIEKYALSDLKELINELQ